MNLFDSIKYKLIKFYETHKNKFIFNYFKIKAYLL